MRGDSQGVRVAVCLALLASQPGCVLAPLTVKAARGSANGVLVHSVFSLDQAWFAPGKGLVLCGTVRPGGAFPDWIVRGSSHGAAFTAALPLAELSGSRPPEQLSYRRFHETENGCDCAVMLAGSRRVPVSESPGVQLLNPPGLNRWVAKLEDQRVHVDPLPELANPPLDFALGPRGGQPAFWLLLPPAAALDVPIGLGVGTAFMTAAGAVMIFYYTLWYPGTYLVTGAPPVTKPKPPPEPVPDPCADFAATLFPDDG